MHMLLKKRHPFVKFNSTYNSSSTGRLKAHFRGVTGNPKNASQARELSKMIICHLRECKLNEQVGRKGTYNLPGNVNQLLITYLNTLQVRSNSVLKISPTVAFAGMGSLLSCSRSKLTSSSSLENSFPGITW